MKRFRFAIVTLVLCLAGIAECPTASTRSRPNFYSTGVSDSGMPLAPRSDRPTLHPRIQSQRQWASLRRA